MQPKLLALPVGVAARWFIFAISCSVENIWEVGWGEGDTPLARAVHRFLVFIVFIVHKFKINTTYL
jgi:hypothetical protein